MNFKIKLRTSGGGKREVDLPATSVQDAIDQIKELYINCTISDIDLITSNVNNIRLYSHGEQVECDQSLIYRPFTD
jgi:hypothetical protein